MMKNVHATGLILVALLLGGCEKAAPPTTTAPLVVLPAADSANPASAIALDRIEKNLGKTAYISVDGIDKVASPKPGAVIPVGGKKFEIAGFAVDEPHGKAAGGVIVLVDGQPHVAVYGGERPDIAAALNNQNYLHSQFWVEIPTDKLSKGPHAISLRVIAADLSGYYEGEWTGSVSVE